MNTPSSYLAQLSTNKGHAQYHFDKNTLDFMVRLASKFEKVKEKVKKNDDLSLKLASASIYPMCSIRAFEWHNNF